MASQQPTVSTEWLRLGSPVCWSFPVLCCLVNIPQETVALSPDLPESRKNGSKKWHRMFSPKMVFSWAPSPKPNGQTNQPNSLRGRPGVKHLLWRFSRLNSKEWQNTSELQKNKKHVPASNFRAQSCLHSSFHYLNAFGWNSSQDKSKQSSKNRQNSWEH